MAETVPKISENSRRIAKNTLALYFRMLLLLIIGLYTSRVVLHALGETDLGVYTTVGGFVAMFAVISNSLSSAISRFLTYEMGKGDKGRLSGIFSTAVIIQLSIAFLIVVLSEVIGPWYIDRYMTIPPERLHSAKVIFQFSVLTFAINLISVPYNASIIAHEKMTAFALIGLFEGVCKLVIALLISVIPMDRLVFYGLAMCAVAVVVRIAYQVYCRVKFEECRVGFSFDRKLLKEMFGFAGWNFIGAGAAVLKDHGGTLIINMFYP
ncbi:MAG: lipopolysaccharide biosynthesis protein, partial [Bacteroidales bacterium]|nr:lipopolysaccharide biosynthesis protein [Bacteroidales bacterium]